MHARRRPGSDSVSRVARPPAQHTFRVGQGDSIRPRIPVAARAGRPAGMASGRPLHRTHRVCKRAAQAIAVGMGGTAAGERSV